MRVSVAIAVACLSMTGLSAADDASAAARKFTHIEAQPLASALQAFAKDRGIQLVYRSEIVGETRTGGAVGDLTLEEALTQLLSGTGLTFQYLEDQAITIVPLSAITSQSQSFGDPSGSAASADSIWQRFRLAQSDSRESAQNVEGQSREIGTSPDTESKRGTYANTEVIEVRAIPEVLVRGSKAINTDIPRSRDDAQPYVVFDREALTNSGSTSVEDFLKNRLPMASNASTNAQSATGRNPSSRINLRGLGAGQTLILIDGRRVAGYNTGGTIPEQPDLNGIPLSAIERIEVLPTTASGIYGGGATGGVINIILKRDYTGMEARATYGGSFEGGGSSRRIDLSFGTNMEGGRTNLLVTGSHADANALLVGDRDFLVDARQHILRNNPSAITGPTASPPLGATTNIRSNTRVGGVLQNLTLKGSNTPLNSLITHVPEGYAGYLSDAGAALLANAGQYNLALAETSQIRGANQSLLNEPTMTSLGMTLRREFSPKINAFLELGGYRSRSEIDYNGSSGTFTIPASSEINPFNEAITVTTPVYGADQKSISELRSLRAVGGVIVDLGADWQAEADYSWNKTRFLSSFPDSLTPGANAAITGGTLNVLRDTTAFPVDFSSFIGTPIQQGPARTTLQNATLRLAGPIPFDLPGGRPIVTTLLEHRKESMAETVNPPSTTQAGNRVPPRSQTIDSVYAEFRVPLFSSQNAIPLVELLELQVAARWDEYDVTATTSSVALVNPAPIVEVQNTTSSTNPTFALRYQPIRDVMVRGSYGTGFLPPAVNQLVRTGPNLIPASALGNLVDPRRGGEAVTGDSTGRLQLVGGGNADLQAEESKSWSAGLVFTPRALDGLRLSMDWTKIEKSNEIVAVGQARQTDFDNEQYVPGIIIRDDPAPGDPFGVGRVIGFNAGLFNIAHREVEVIDFAADYAYETASWGIFRFSAIATRLIHLKSQLTPNSPTVENAGAIATVGSSDAGLRWKANATLSWSFRQLELDWTTRYFDEYWLRPDHLVDVSQGSATVPRQTYHDFSAKYSFGTAGSGTLGLLNDLEAVVGTRNLFNKRPPIDVIGQSGLAGSPGYSVWGDPRRATYFVTLRKQF